MLGIQPKLATIRHIYYLLQYLSGSMLWVMIGNFLLFGFLGGVKLSGTQGSFLNLYSGVTLSGAQWTIYGARA